MKNVLVIGGSSGVGAATVELLQKNNYAVYSTYKRNEPVASKPTTSFHHLDVLDSEVDLSFLPDTIDGLVYCPGSINLKPFSRIKPGDFLEDLELQVVGAIKCIQAALVKLKASENSSIVLFSSVAAQFGFNFHSQVSVSKGAIEGLTKALSAELSPRIRVNSIAPSLLDTPLANKLLSSEEKRRANAERHPLKRIGKAQDIAQMVEFLLSENSSWITGQVLPVDGGMSRLRS
ncbi:MAG: SDR family oxidoreductase [Crocinitomicaceae bacterium]|jgi:NAD(P)-dependent dehydrogenase (short-subunit alcohol dehydrogenase family)|nr:SDR family oxidoreductase [Crocinitomicaceae bacterium]MBT5403411.1 SDR family oxidoreductase [Crocinitomicaceae bacterium]MBT6028879.1 SDR family oxidoreductase [Crocinitomicaceae bacterium]MBT6515662.1 SDR family oxidoreductase [Crocinitomicaceae bacterium]